MRTGLLPVIIAATSVVGLARLSRVIAGSVEVLYLVSRGVLPATAFLGHYLVPTLLGNTIGGVSLVAAVQPRAGGVRARNGDSGQPRTDAADWWKSGGVALTCSKTAC